MISSHSAELSIIFSFTLCSWLSSGYICSRATDLKSLLSLKSVKHVTQSDGR